MFERTRMCRIPAYLPNHMVAHCSTPWFVMYLPTWPYGIIISTNKICRIHNHYQTTWRDTSAHQARGVPTRKTIWCRISANQMCGVPTYQATWCHISMFVCMKMFMGCAMGTIGSSTQYNSHDRLLIFINSRNTLQHVIRLLESLIP
jgi:hypothetical protein